MDYLAFAKDIVAASQRKGAGQTEVYIETGEEFSAIARHGKIESLKQATARGLGLRVFYKKRLGHGFINDFSSSAVQSLIESTLELAKASVDDPCNSLPSVDEPNRDDLDLVDTTLDQFTSDQKIESALQLDHLIFELDSRIVKNEGASVSAGMAETFLANSNGFANSYRHSSVGFSVSPVAQDGQAMYNGHWYSYARKLSDVESIETVARTAVERTIRMLGARKISTTRVPVIFDPSAAVTFLSSFFKVIDGDRVNRGLSCLSDQLHKKIADGALTIVDDGLAKSLLGTRPFDGEGITPKRAVIVDRGYLRSYVYDHKAAEKASTLSTGHAHRDFTTTPAIGPNNMYIAAGEVSAESILRDTPKGLLVTGLMGFGFDPVVGTFSFGAEGLWIENGETIYPVHEIVVSSTLQEMLNGVAAVGNDLRFRGAFSSPTIKFESMTISGN